MNQVWVVSSFNAAKGDTEVVCVIASEQAARDYCIDANAEERQDYSSDAEYEEHGCHYFWEMYNVIKD